MKERNFYKLLFKLSLIFLLLLTSCAKTSETPQPTTATPPTGALGLNCVQTEAAIKLTLPDQITASPFYINGQVILLGPSASVEKVAQQQDIPLYRLAGCTFSLPDQIIQTIGGSPEFPLPTSKEAQPLVLPFYDPVSGKYTLSADDKLEMNLYMYDEGKFTFQDILKQAALEPDVFVDPNYLVGNSAKSACGDPGGLDGKPFEVEGSPFEVEGSPGGGAVLTATLKAFWDQWAFNLMNIPNPNNSPSDVTGEDVRIAIFDTSPYQLAAGSATMPVTAPEILPPLEMTVHHPFELFVIPTSTSLTNPVDVSGHGLFVASLAHAVAPDSQIDLYRVLDRFGCGDLFHLNSAMLDFVNSKLDEKDLSASLERPAVMNLSLGVLKPRQLPENVNIEDIDEAIREAYNMVMERGNSIATLSFMTNLAYQAGIVVVAAAGNDSLPGEKPLSMELPAAYPFVIGVSASTKQDQRACYSNEGDVIAPGAEAGITNISTNQQICTPLATQCPGIDATAIPGSCEYGVVGLFKPLDTEQRDFAYWVGTSFATPLISGKAALRYAITGDRDQVYTDIVSKFPYP